MKLFAVLGVFGLLSVAALAQTDLYAPTPPADSAFVRVLAAGGPVSATLGGSSVTAARGAASAYVVQPQGTLNAKLGGVSGSVRLEAGHFYSLFATGGKLVLLTDPAVQNRGKALLTLYNLSRYASLDLKTADGKTTVLSGVKPGSSASRAVNGITVDLAAFAGGKAVGTVRALKLERANAYALVMTDDGLSATQGVTRFK